MDPDLALIVIAVISLAAIVGRTVVKITEARLAEGDGADLRPKDQYVPTRDPSCPISARRIDVPEEEHNPPKPPQPHSGLSGSPLDCCRYHEPPSTASSACNRFVLWLRWSHPRPQAGRGPRGLGG